MIRTYFLSVHINEPDVDASRDFFFQELMSENFPRNPLQGYFCNNDVSSVKIPYWRAGAMASQEMMSSGFNEDGKLTVNFAENLDSLDIPFYLMASECNRIIGTSYQKQHLQLFKNIEFKVINGAGHYMLNEKPDECLAYIRSVVN